MDNYEVIGVIGKGSFGAVTKVRRKSDGKLFVWKEISYSRMNEREKQQLVAEVNILRELRHPNIVKYYDRIIDREKGKIFIVMEFCDGGDLAHLVKKCKQEGQFLTEEKVWEIFSQVADALNLCHRGDRKILHRDIKPGNILLDSNLNVKLCDFGLSRIMGAESVYAYTHVGTPFYMSPEQIGEGKYNEKSDIWSLGCLLFEMAALSPPFDAKSHVELNERIRNGRMGRIPDRYSPELHRVVQWMLTIDSTLRPSIEHILNIPQVAMKLRDRKTRDLQSTIKQREADLRKKEEEVKKMEEDLKKRELALTERENRVAEAEKMLAQKGEMQGKEDAKQPGEANTPKPLMEANTRPQIPRGRHFSPFDNLPNRAVRDFSGEKRTISPKIAIDGEAARPRTALPRPESRVTPQDVDRFIQHYRDRPKTALPARVPKRYHTLNA